MFFRGMVLGEWSLREKSLWETSLLGFRGNVVRGIDVVPPK
jgi:hypothetical protein